MNTLESSIEDGNLNANFQLFHAKENWVRRCLNQVSSTNEFIFSWIFNEWKNVGRNFPKFFQFGIFFERKYFHKQIFNINKSFLKLQEKCSREKIMELLKAKNHDNVIKQHQNFHKSERWAAFKSSPNLKFPFLLILVASLRLKAIAISSRNALKWISRLLRLLYVKRHNGKSD